MTIYLIEPEVPISNCTYHSLFVILFQLIQGGITAAYVYHKNYKVEAVMAINPLKRISSEDKNRQSRQSPSQAFANTFFSKVLDEACEQERAKNIHVYTSGYTRDALPYHNFINMREYN